MLKVSTISFPGLGIGDFNINNIALSIGKLQITWYGILITFGIILACIYVAFRAKQVGINVDTVMDYAIFTVISGIIGARLYYVVMTINQGLYHSFYDVIAIWNGGLAIYGGIIGGIIAILVVSKVKKIHPLKFFDCTAPAVLIGQIIGRWGNFINVEAYGRETNLPWRMGIKIYDNSYIYVHPTFLYESLWNLLGFILINLFYKHKKYDGQILLMYVTWYGFGRMLIEGLRTDSLYIGSVRVSQLVGFISFVVGGGILLYMFVRDKINSKKVAGK